MNESSQRTWSFEDRDRWWGCEIMFDAAIDSSFSVKNIKRGANPEPALKNLIKESISPKLRIKNVIESVDLNHGHATVINTKPRWKQCDHV